MKSLLKWGLIGLVGLGVLAAVFGEDEKSAQTPSAAAATSAAGTPESTVTAAEETSTPEPTPDPEVSVEFTGPANVHTDNVVLKGTVNPSNAHVRIKGQAVAVRRGKWKLPVTLTKHGDNTFRVVATRKGFVKDTATVVVTRKLSAAEKAVARQQAAERRANGRACAQRRATSRCRGSPSRASTSNCPPRQAKASRRLRRSMRWITSMPTGRRKPSSRRGATSRCHRCRGPT